jgi:hypothetical protein
MQPIAPSISPLSPISPIPPIAHVQPAVLPTRFAALNALLQRVTATGCIIERTAIPFDSGLDAISIFAENAPDAFLICRINDDTFTIRRVEARE